MAGVVEDALDAEALNTPVVMWASQLISFSSQYNADGWSAAKALGSPTVYPNYGDIQGAWASGNITNHEFIELGFPEKVYVDKVEIYETFNAGAVSRVLAKGVNGSWVTLWTSPQVTRIAHSRIFDVGIQPTKFSTDALRIEVNCLAAGTWAEIDAVRLTGVTSRIDSPPPMSRLSNHLSVLVSNPEFSDVVFDVDGHKVHGHRAILSARSEYFRAMFSEDTQMYCGTITVLPIPNISYKAFLLMLHYLYTNKMPEAPDTTSLVEVVRVGDMYNMMDLKRLGVSELNSIINLKNVINVYIEATQKEPILHAVEKMCLTLMSENLQAVTKSEEFCRLPKDKIIDLIQICTANISLN